MKILDKIFKTTQNQKDFGKISISQIQRKYKIGFFYAQNIMNALFLNGYVGEEDGYNPRQLLCEENKVFQFIEENFKSYRPIEYSEYYRSEDNGGIYNVSCEENAKDFDNMEGHDFEYFCAELLRKKGFKNVEVTKGSGDQGIDIIAYRDDVKYGIQCKCYSHDIGNKAIQEAYAGAKFYDCHVPVVLTNRYFTTSAKELAQKTQVLLWDRDKLNSMINSPQAF